MKIGVYNSMSIVHNSIGVQNLIYQLGKYQFQFYLLILAFADSQS